MFFPIHKNFCEKNAALTNFKKEKLKVIFILTETQ